MGEILASLDLKVTISVTGYAHCPNIRYFIQTTATRTVKIHARNHLSALLEGLQD